MAEAGEENQTGSVLKGFGLPNEHESKLHEEGLENNFKQHGVIHNDLKP